MAVGGDKSVGDHFFHRPEGGAQGCFIGGHLYVDGVCLVGSKGVEPEVAALFEYDIVRTIRGVMGIIVGEMGELGEFFGSDIVFPEVRSFFFTAVGEEEDAVVVPHGQFVVSVRSRDVLVRVAGQVKNMDLTVPAAVVTFPVTAYLRFVGEGNLAAVRRQGAVFGIGQWQLLGCAAGGGQFEELVEPFASAAAAGGEEDTFPVRVPAGYPLG